MKNAILFVLAALVAALAYVTLRQRSEIAELRAAQAKPPVAAAVKHASKPPAAPDAPVARARTETPPVDVPPRPPAATADRTPRPERPNPASFLAGVGSMMTNPAMKQMIRTQTKMSLDMRYERLLKFFNLTPEQVDQFKSLMVDRQMALMDSGLAFMGGKMTPEEQKQKAKEIEAVKTSFDEKLKNMLGAENFDALQQYEDTEPERMQVDRLKQSLAASTEPLSEQQEYDLVNAMHQARTNSSSALVRQRADTPPDASQFTEAAMTRALRDMGQVQTSYAASARAILTPAQFAEFQRHADQQRQMNEMGMRFAAQMFGATNGNAGASVSVTVEAAP